MLKRFVIAGAVAAGLVTGASGVATADSGTDPGYVTWAEFQSIHKGDTRAEVHQLTGARGVLAYTQKHPQVRDYVYHTSTKYGWVQVTFKRDHAHGAWLVAAKDASWRS